MSGGADPAASCRYRWTGLRRQGRQQQVHTRLKSTCRRTTGEKPTVEVWAAVTSDILPRRTVSATTGQILRSPRAKIGSGTTLWNTGAMNGPHARPFGVYVHVPFCATRCGYCDFNTYTPAEGVVREGYAERVLAELALAARVLGDAPAVDTVFVGGGTPTLLGPADLGRILDGVHKTW